MNCFVVKSFVKITLIILTVIPRFPSEIMVIYISNIGCFALDVDLFLASIRWDWFNPLNCNSPTNMINLGDKFQYIVTDFISVTLQKKKVQFTYRCEINSITFIFLLQLKTLYFTQFRHFVYQLLTWFQTGLKMKNCNLVLTETSLINIHSVKRLFMRGFSFVVK